MISEVDIAVCFHALFGFGIVGQLMLGVRLSDQRGRLRSVKLQAAHDPDEESHRRIKLLERVLFRTRSSGVASHAQTNAASSRRSPNSPSRMGCVQRGHGGLAFLAIVVAACVAAWLLVEFRGVSRPAGRITSEPARTLTQSDRNRAEHIAATICAGCHGPGLAGAAAPSLAGVGARRTEETIRRILVRGKGRRKPNPMPGGLVSAQDAAIVARWLATR